MRNLSESPGAPLPALNPRLDEALVARVYRATGRVHVPDFLDAASAARIHRALSEETPWQVVLYDGAEHRELPVASLDELPEAERRDWREKSRRAATRGFSYRYANFRLYENWQQGRDRELWLMRVLEFLSAPPIRELMCRITGDPAIDYADAQATLYRAGDFLTRHDDRVEGKGRRAAYVLGFTPQWVTDWVSLFRVPMLHAVTQVSEFAPARRYSITGWLRQSQASA